jgi:hypothetical protein
MSYKYWTKLIKEVAEEQGFEVSSGDTVFTIDIDKWHSVAYQMKVNSSGYIQAHQWEDGDRWGRAVYSIRSYSGAVNFCQILINSASIQAKV